MATSTLRPSHSWRVVGQPGARVRTRPQNVGEIERVASVIGGATLGLVGLASGRWSGLALGVVGGGLVCRGVTGHCQVYEALGINTADRPQGREASVPAGHGVKVERSITVNKPPEYLYRFWRNFENLPRIMSHLESVRVTGPNRSHWVARALAGASVEWDAEVINERKNELIAWRSLEGSDVDNAGSVHFRRAPAGQGTEIRVSLKYYPLGGKLGAAVAGLFGENPEQQIDDDLRRFRQAMEGGTVPAASGHPSGHGVTAAR